MPSSPYKPVAVFVQELAQTNVVPVWLEQAEAAIMDGDDDAFNALCQQLDDYPAGARKLFVPSIRRSDLLHQAVVNERVAMVQRLIPWSNLRQRDIDGQTALMRAVGVGSLAMVTALLPGSTPTDRDSDGRTALMHALVDSRSPTPDDPIVDALWDLKRLNDKDKKGSTVLHLVMDGSGAYLPRLLDHLDATVSDALGTTPLMRMAQGGDARHLAVVRDALINASDLGQQDRTGATAFLNAVWYRSWSMVDALWDGSDRHHTVRDGRNALHLAVENGVDSQDLVARLVKDGVNPHHRALTGTPFQTSTVSGPVKVFEAFLDHAVLATDDPETDMLAFVMERTLNGAWEPSHPFAWDRLERVALGYDRAALLQRVDTLVHDTGDEALDRLARFKERLPAVFSVYEQHQLRTTMGLDPSDRTAPTVPRARL